MQPDGGSTAGRPHGAGIAGLAALALAAAALLGAQEIDEEKATRVKVAYLYNFVRVEYHFVTWPKSAFADARSPMVIGVLGADPFGPLLDRAVGGRRVGERTIEIRRIEGLSEEEAREGTAREARTGMDAIRRRVRSCHVLFVSKTQAEHLDRVLEILEGAPVLTVSDATGFAARGGMIELAISDGRIVPRVNRAAAERERLRFSAKLLRLATIVDEDDPGAGGGEDAPARAGGAADPEDLG